jgi:hypothetical protein
LIGSPTTSFAYDHPYISGHNWLASVFWLVIPYHHQQYENQISVKLGCQCIFLALSNRSNRSNPSLSHTHTPPHAKSYNKRKYTNEIILSGNGSSPTQSNRLRIGYRYQTRTRPKHDDGRGGLTHQSLFFLSSSFCVSFTLLVLVGSFRGQRYSRSGFFFF